MGSENLRVDYDNYETSLNAKYRQRSRYVPPDPSLECSQLPGVIIAVHVKPGQTVSPGTPLYTLEAMKMHNVFRARREAVVKQVNVKPGEKIVKHHPVIEYR